MLRNQIPISRIISIGLLGITLMLISFFSADLDRVIERGYLREEDMLFLGIGLIALICSIGLFMAQKWARVLFIILLGVLLILWMVLIGTRINLSRRDGFPLLGVSLFFVCFVIAMALLLYNKKLSDEFEDSHLDSDYHDTIDSDLLE